MKEKNKSRKKRQTVMSVIFIIILIGAWFYPVLGFFIPICMLLGLIIALFKGRKWCDWFCPRGSFFDIALKKISADKNILGFIKHNITRLLVLALLMGVMLYRLIHAWPDIQSIGMIFTVLLTITTLIGIGFGIFIHARTWCYLCPIGTFSSLIAGIKSSISVDSELCSECDLCGKICPMQISPYKSDKKNHKDCLRCDLCLKSCPQKALKR